ncbi:hypothetical protein V6N13_094212 [Hibiscus sabdariffa]
MHEARSLPTHTTISPLTCPLRTSSSIHTHRSTTHTTERFGRGAEETMSEGTPQPPIPGRHRLWLRLGRAGGTTRPIKARSASPAVGTSRPVLTVRRTGRPTPRSNYELFNCNNLNIRYWSWNYRGCWHQTCPPMDPR